MNYDHSYHAGSFTDVFKHLVLISLLKKLQLKETAICYLDTHSGFPYYDIQSVKAQRTQEAQQGIKKLWQAEKTSVMIRNYFKLIDDFNLNFKTQRRYYPGSAAFAAMLKRPQDTLILNELEPNPYQALKDFFKRQQKIYCHQQDAYQIMNALLPPKESRGLVFIDPPYEHPKEFDLLLAHVTRVLKHWSHGVYAIWYPVKEMRRIELFINRLKKLTDRPQINFMCCPWPNDVKQRLSGSGVLIINPPWQIEQVINPLIKELEALF